MSIKEEKYQKKALKSVAVTRNRRTFAASKR
jgi:hypothetical protein